MRDKTAATEGSVLETKGSGDNREKKFSPHSCRAKFNQCVKTHTL